MLQTTHNDILAALKRFATYQRLIVAFFRLFFTTRFVREAITLLFDIQPHFRFSKLSDLSSVLGLFPIWNG